ncbi:MAG: TIGR00730 family Rossman fold protein [Kofleriaceae bacterium]|nr:TIGR00730 family Rossman fold protein [Kofleriaceae bacterium]
MRYVDAVLHSVCVFLSSSNGRPAEVEAIRELGRELARRELTLVYGGAHRGLMGVLADAVIESGGRTIGVIPQALVDLEIAHGGLTELHVVETMHQRKAMMFTHADAFVVAPGGFGTLEEAFEQLTGLQLGYHRKPIVFLDLGFWTAMEAFLDQAVAAGVLRAEARALFRTAPSASTALDVLAAW